MLSSALVLAAAPIAGVLVAARRERSARRYERDCARRLPLGPDGVIVGAEPIDLPAPGGGTSGGRLALLLHGFGDTPQTLVNLATHLNARGWAVRAPLLPGHGRTLRAFAASRASSWIAHARAELAAAQSQYESVALVGLSMGGAIATVLAAETPALPALVLLAPYTSMRARLQRVARLHRTWGMFARYLRGRGDRSILDPEARARSLAYGVVTPRLLAELAVVVEEARRAAPGVRAPTLVVQSREDHRIAPADAERAFALVGAQEKRLVWLDGCGHIVTVDHGRERVDAETAGWLERYASARVSEDACEPLKS